MAISVTDLGHNSNAAGATVALSALSVPANVLVAVGTSDHSVASSGGSCTDSGSNTYTSIVAAGLNNVSTNGFAQVWNFNGNATTLSSITYTKVTSGAAAAIAALYATGVAGGNAVDSGVTASNTGVNTTTPTVGPSGTPALANTLLVAFIAAATSMGTNFTQDAGDGTWVVPFATDTTQNTNCIIGGNQLSSVARSWNPTCNNTLGLGYAAFIVGFQPALGAPEINIIGRHSPTAFKRFGYNAWDAGVPQKETNPHFVGKHQPRMHTISTSYRWHTDTGVPQPETNPHMLGRFTPAQLRGLAAHRQTYPTRDVAQETNVNTIGRFVAPNLSILGLLRQNYPTADTVAETNVHTLGRFQPLNYQIITGLRQNYPTADVEPETNVHFVGRHQVAFHRITPALRQNHPPADTQPETNIFTLGRFAPAVHRIAAALRQTYPTADFAQETNVHFLGRYRATVIARFNYNSLDSAVPPPQPETNPHTVGRFITPQLQLLPLHRQNYPTADSQPETNPHVVGRFAPMRIVTLALYRQNPALDVVVIQPETNVSTLGRFTPAQHRILPGQRQNYPTADVVRETNVHTPGRFSLKAHFITPTLRQNPAQDVPNQAEPHMLGRHAPVHILTLPGLRQNVPTDAFVAPPATLVANPHMLGRHEPLRFKIRRDVFENPALDLPPILFGLAFARDFALWSGDDIIAELPPATAEATDSALWSVTASSIGSDRINPMGPYQIQSAIELEGAFTGQNGQNTDPTTVTLFLEDPDGNETSYQWPSGQVVRTGVGFFTFTFTAAISGLWTYKWQGTGAVVATSADTSFEVLPSALIPG